MGETAGDGGENWIPTGARNVAVLLAAREFGFGESFGEIERRAAEDDGAASDGVDGLTFAEGKAGGVANRADFSAVGVFAAGTVSEVFDEEEVVVFLDFFELADVDREAEGVLEDEDFEFFIFLSELVEGGGRVVGEEVAVFRSFEVDKDGLEAGEFDGFEDGVASEGVDGDVVALFDLAGGKEALESEGEGGTARVDEAGVGEVGAIAFGESAFEGEVVVFGAEDKRVAKNVAGGVVGGEAEENHLSSLRTALARPEGSEM